MEMHPVNLLIIVTALLAVMLLRAGLVARRHRKEKRQLAAAGSDRERAEVAALKDRVAVLERITVEKEHALESEIELLRDR